MLTPKYLMDVAEPVRQLFSGIEQQMACDIAERIVKAGSYIGKVDYNVFKGKQFGKLTRELRSMLRKGQAISKQQIQRLMTESVTESVKTDDAIFRAAGIEPIPVADSPAQQAIILQGTQSTAQLMENYTHTMATSSYQAFTSSLDQAYLSVVTGSSDYVSAIRHAVNELASNGVSSFSYASGAHTSVEAGVRRAILTGINQTVAKLALARCDEFGTDLVETTSHAGARPTHEVWQGMVFSISGRNPHYGDFYADTGYGEGDGLCGWNCYHSFYPYFDGLSTQAFEHDPSAAAGRDNDEDYELQQKQRYYERMIREAKRRCEVINAAREEANDPALVEGLTKDFEDASVVLKRREAKLRNFLNEHGRTRLRDRESIGNWNRSISGRAVWANRKASGR
ncbi:MAG: phage minor capsid protein [Clostridia bacterium]|nr:phage minor capsid protein [Clostridia bacterium]